MMLVKAQIFRLSGMPPNWVLLGQADVFPGQRVLIDTGDGSCFTVVGVADGASFRFHDQLDIILKVNGVANHCFHLHYDPDRPRAKGQYKAVVSEFVWPNYVTQEKVSRTYSNFET